MSLIAIKLNRCEKEVVQEFFQLFKTPWEFYQEGHAYNVIITDDHDHKRTDAQLIIRISSHDHLQLKQSVSNGGLPEDSFVLLKSSEMEFPVYSGVTSIECDQCLATMGPNNECVVSKSLINSEVVINLGYDLFKEVKYLLSKGQPVINAIYPTLDIHIYLLRKWIVATRIKLVEIPPVKLGSPFHVCLTHDVDFVKIKNYRFDHTLVGFLYRAIISSVVGSIRGKYPLKRIFLNWFSVITIPLIFLGLKKDFWMQFRNYIKLENGCPSTFFFVPFKNKPGKIDDRGTSAPATRTTKYEVAELKKEIDFLLEKKCEIGVHGIDAWLSKELAEIEFEKIQSLTGEKNIGIRMHWLFFAENSFDHLEKAGYSFDSTLGYNENVGYRSGTHQVFKPPSTDSLLELPLHIMDTSLFYEGRMNMGFDEGANIIRKFSESASTFGGVLTLNWHHRSIAPERLWGDVYQMGIQHFITKGAIIETAGSIVNWFRKRRLICFQKVECTKDAIKVKLSFDKEKVTEDDLFFLRIHNFKIKTEIDAADDIGQQSYSDFVLTGVREMNFK